MPQSLAFLANQVFSRFYTFTFLCGYFQKIIRAKCKASHPSIKQFFCIKPKLKFLAVSQPESANASSNDCKGSFDSLVQEDQPLTVRISKALSVSANSQPPASNSKTFQSWIKLKGFDESLQMNIGICSFGMLTEAKHVWYALSQGSAYSGLRDLPLWVSNVII